MKPVVLCILDGWGERGEASDNAISQANTPFWDDLKKKCPHSLLETSGLSVGLPEGQMGNSEVGHMNIGSGRVVMQNLPLIDSAIQDGSLALKEDIQKMIGELKRTGKSCHLLGMLSDGGVHSHQSHISAIAKIVAKENIDVKIHAFLDGRDVPPESAREYIKSFKESIKGFDNIEIVTASGRYYAMDRDNRWDRVQLAYDAIISGEGDNFPSIERVMDSSYSDKIYDEFVKPAVIGDYKGMADGDAMVMVNFRSDRARQILSALVAPDFNGFKRKKIINFSYKIGMVEYSDDLNKLLSILFPAPKLEKLLGQVISENGLTQLRIAETEKYAHVTFFFNGGKEDKYKGEERILVPSPDVRTYDMQPEMSAPQVTDNLVTAIKSNKFDLIVVNYANADMVGHTGNKKAATKAIETVDQCLSKLVKEVEKAGGVIFITADHGNCEQMTDEESGQPHTSHTLNPVPFLLAGKDVEKYKLDNGRLCDIAPTLLKIMGIKKPAQMTGVELING